jgi:hypothetical protein
VREPLIVRGIDVASLLVCRSCTDLRGHVVLPDGPKATQHCACPHGNTPRWPGCDFDRAAELCRCCCGALVASGSRWSSFFCDKCRVPVRELNEACGYAMIPVGRHSIMNGCSLRGTPRPRPDELAPFIDDVRDIFQRTAHLDEWRRIRARRVLDTVLDTNAVPIGRYLDAAAELDAGRRAYDELLEWWVDG